MSYIEEIEKAFIRTSSGDTSIPLVQKSLQHENWMHLSNDIKIKVTKHKDYQCLSACNDPPLPINSTIHSQCQGKRIRKNVKNAYTLFRYKNKAPFQDLDLLEDDDLPRFFESIQASENRDVVWVTSSKLSLRSKNDLYEIVQRLGLYHWVNKSLTPTTVFLLKWENVYCVKPNALVYRIIDIFTFYRTLQGCRNSSTARGLARH